MGASTGEDDDVTGTGRGGNTTTTISPPSSSPTMTVKSASSRTTIIDKSSQSNPHEVIVTYLEWNATIDFTTQTLEGTAYYDVELISTPCSSIKLDTNHLNIQRVTLNGVEVTTYTLGEVNTEKTHLGQCLSIPLLVSSSPTTSTTTTTEEEEDYYPINTVFKIAITYKTTEKCSALQWLPPSQTAGKRHPYLFSQCQAIHARSLLPCMDCPGVKMTYEASITVPKWSTCIMSAISKGSTTSSSPDYVTYNFIQPVPIPSYLLAIVVGDLASIDISPRVKVWSEPCLVESAAYEFSQTEEFLSLAEKLVGVPYQWGRYDLLCLPPSFPYGGMENPCLTFVTPTLLAGDRSLADVVAHEIAHSWSGNLVTNATWEHFWLNEGWTTWLQRKIMTRITRNPKFFDFDSIGGWHHLEESVKLQLEDGNADFTRLIPVLGDNDPDDAFSSIPYEKGFNLLYTLERRVGTRKFEDFAKSYFDKYKYLTVTSYEFRTYFEKYFDADEKSLSKMDGFDWDAWYHNPGMPPIGDKPDFDRTLSKEAESLAEAWITYNDNNEDGGASSSSSSPSVDIKGWSSNQIVCFLDTVIGICEKRSKAMLTVDTVVKLGDEYGMRSSKNSEILFRYCRIAIAAGDEEILPIVIRFITTQGRMKFVRPLYRELYHSKMGKELAVQTFINHVDFYHPIASKMIARDLQVDGACAAAGGEGDDDGEERKKKLLGVMTGAKIIFDGVGPLVYAGAGLVALTIAGMILHRRRR